MNSLERDVLIMIGENPDSPDVFADTDDGMRPIRTSINDAIQEINILTGGYKETFYVPLIENSIFYRLDWQRGHLGWVTDCWLMNQKRRLEQVDLKRLNTFDSRWMRHTANPDHYFQVSLNVIGVHPKPASGTDVLQLNCVVVPDPYTNDQDRVKLLDEYRWAAVNYAVSEYYASRGDAKEAQNHWQSYVETLGGNLQYPKSNEYLPQFRTSKEPWPVETNRRPG
jgi:hypothetical protein